MKERTTALVVVALLASVLAARGAAGEAAKTAPDKRQRLTMKALSVKKIWDQGKHNAFTDLIRFGDRFYCVFRESASHASPGGKIRVLTSADDGKTWKSAALLALKGYDLPEGFDLRDPKISRMPDGRLMLLGGAGHRKPGVNVGDPVPTGSFVSFSKDGAAWTAPKLVGDPKRWIWRVTWHKGRGYGVDYNSSEPTTLLMTADGLTYKTVIAPLSDRRGGRWKQFPNEATLRFAADGTCYCLHRGGGNEPLLGTARAPYTKWTWKELVLPHNYIGGPDMMQLPTGDWICAGRLREPPYRAASGSMSLFLLNVEAGKATELLRLPSGGDTSYPGLLWHDGVLWVSYYSSHEGKTSIYLARVKVTVEAKTSEVTDEKGSTK